MPTKKKKPEENKVLIYKKAVLEAVQDMNRHVVWVADKQKIFDLRERRFRTSSDFMLRSEHAAKELAMGDKYPTRIPKLWLQHKDRRTVHTSTFAPGGGDIVEIGNGIEAVNLWSGWQAEKGDVAPFLRLHDLIVSRLTPAQRSMPLDMLAFHAQNPDVRIPYTITITGVSHLKDLWARAVREAFAPWSIQAAGRQLFSRTYDWAGARLLAHIQDGQEILGSSRCREVLSPLIVGETFPHSDRFVSQNGNANRLLWVITGQPNLGAWLAKQANKHFMIGAPSTVPDGLEDEVRGWLEAGGAKHLMQWLLDRDVNSFRALSEAPATGEQYAAKMERLTPVARLAEDMKTAKRNIVAQWIEDAMEWAQDMRNTRYKTNAETLIRNLNAMEIRPFYTPEELVKIFPHLASEMYGISKFMIVNPSVMARELRNNGIEYLQNADDPRGFMWRGRLRQYLIIADRDEWLEPITQGEFERVMKNFPKYGELAG